jgi:hypothetical protein
VIDGVQPNPVWFRLDVGIILASAPTCRKYSGPLVAPPLVLFYGFPGMADIFAAAMLAFEYRGLNGHILPP